MTQQRKVGARAEYRLLEVVRVRESCNLAEKYQQLKSLTVELTFFSSEGLTRNSHIKYKVNLDHAKSVFRIDCINSECIRGDFDLTEDLAHAVAAHRTTAAGEKCCQGWRCKTAIGRIQCHNILRYTLSLAY